MRAMRFERPASIDTAPLRVIEMPEPEPGPGEIRVRVRVCGICRTDLHVIEGDLPTVKAPLTPGHQVVGVVDRLGPRASRFALGDRAGIAWLRSTDGLCEACRRGDENLCAASRYTGYHEDGGYAEVRRRVRSLRLQDPRRVFRRGGNAASLRGDHRLPGAAPERGR